MRTVLDTSVLIADRHLAPVDGDLAISVISVAEIHFGVLRALDDRTRADRLQLLTTVERLFDALPVDEAVAASYGRIASAVTKLGRTPRSRNLDLMIAATAHAHSARVATLNPDDFRGLEGLVDVVVPVRLS